jgi:putative transposase
VRYACIARHEGEYPVRLMCRVLHVSPAGFYHARRRAPSRRARADARLRVHVRAHHAESDGTYGARRIAEALTAAGLPCGRHRAARLLRLEGLQGVATRRFRVPTTVADRAHAPAPNTLARQFAVGTTPAALDRRWAADVTYLPTWAGWLYLAVVLDVASRRVIGWAMGPSLASELPLAALAMARRTRRPASGTLQGCVHHSDQGRQYSSAGYRAALAAAGLTASMSRRGDCWDNAVVESFFATLKTELIHRRAWATRAEVQGAVFRYIEAWYNPHRLHSALGYQSPAQYEAALLIRSCVA